MNLPNKLEGINDFWHYTRLQIEMPIIMHLPPGKFIFKEKLQYDGRMGIREPTELDFINSPPY